MALADLNRLQEKDLELDRIREEQEQVPDDLRSTRKEWKSLEDKLAGLQDQLHEVQHDYRQNDLELQDLTQKQAKAKESQKNAQGAKEQTQFENVIRQLGDRISELEDVILPMLGEIERLEGEVAAVKEAMARTRPRLDELEAANQARVDGLEAAYQAKWTERSRMAELLPQDLVQEYQTIRKARKGVGLARMVLASAGHRCGACNVQLPTHVAQRVHQGNVVVRCPSCGRILWTGSA